jgi:two-component system sensor histidine kinase KdpD
LASQLDFKRRETAQDRDGPSTNAAPDQIMVCLSSQGPNSARLLRFASRLAGRLNRNWYAVYVQTPREEPTVIDATTQRLLSDTLTLANQLGAMVFTFKGQDIADTILRFAQEYRVGQIVIGKPRPIPWWRRLLGAKSVAEELMHRARGVTIVVVDAESGERIRGEHTERPEPGSAKSATAAVGPKGTLSRLLSPARIVIWEDPTTKRDVQRRLVEAITRDAVGVTYEQVTQKLAEREAQGSTFLNEGIALPHARLDALREPQVSLGLTRSGVLDAATEKPVEAIFLLLSPTSGANVHLQLLAKVGRALQNRELRRSLQRARTPQDALEAIRDFEAAASGTAAPVA